MESISEDEVVTSLIHFHNTEHTNPEIRPEEHYNHFGSRGIVDLFIDTEANGTQQQWLYEVKSESAVQGATGANEIIRQFNRMRDYFFEGTEHEPGSYVTYRLVFVPTDYNLRHIADNYSIYRELVGVVEDEENNTYFRTQIAFYNPLEDYVVDLPVRRVKSLNNEVFWSFMFNTDRDLAKELQQTFEDICGPLTQTEAIEVPKHSVKINNENVTLKPGDETVVEMQSFGIPEQSRIQIEQIEKCPGGVYKYIVEVLPQNVGNSQYNVGAKCVGDDKYIFDAHPIEYLFSSS